MWTGIIQGTVTSTIKHPSMTKGKMLIVQPLNPLTGAPDGLAQVAMDTLGAGLGQKVLVSGDGLGTQRILSADKTCPARLAVMAILDDNSIQTRNAGAK